MTQRGEIKPHNTSFQVRDVYTLTYIYKIITFTVITYSKSYLQYLGITFCTTNCLFNQLKVAKALWTQ